MIATAILSAAVPPTLAAERRQPHIDRIAVERGPGLWIGNFRAGRFAAKQIIHDRDVDVFAVRGSHLAYISLERVFVGDINRTNFVEMPIGAGVDSIVWNSPTSLILGREHTDTDVHEENGLWLLNTKTFVCRQTMPEGAIGQPLTTELLLSSNSKYIAAGGLGASMIFQVAQIGKWQSEYRQDMFTAFACCTDFAWDNDNALFLAMDPSSAERLND